MPVFPPARTAFPRCPRPLPGVRCVQLPRGFCRPAPRRDCAGSASWLDFRTFGWGRRAAPGLRGLRRHGGVHYLVEAAAQRARNSRATLDPSPPPEQIVGLALAGVSALTAAVFSAASAAQAALPGARKAALRDSLTGKPREALDRYIRQGNTIETRWSVIRVMSVATSALLFGTAFPPSLGQLGHPVAAVAATLVTYGLAAQILTTLAERSPERSSTLLLRALYPLELTAALLALPFVAVGALFGRSQQLPKMKAEVTETEVELMVSEGEQMGAFDHEQSEMIRNVLDFGDLTAGEVMVPRTHVTAFELGIDSREMLARVVDAEHSRYPIYREHIDNVVGVLHVKDLLTFVSEHEISEIRLDDLLRKPAVFVPETQSASSVLKDMRAGRQHLAVVIDEFGGMSGIVTLEDLIEEIVGDIRDEHDADDDAPIIDLGDGRLLVDASVPIADLSRYLGAELPEDGDYNSLGGFLVDRLGRVPPTGTKLEEQGLQFIVREANERRVAKVEIVRGRPSPESLAPGSKSSAAA